MQDVYYTPAETTEQSFYDDNIKGDRTDEDLLFQSMIDLGISLSAKIDMKQIAGKTGSSHTTSSCVIQALPMIT